eukprot:GILK01002221.1.p1 GENE.GILK01002221.1~~GILK01002221.1.p1  ORF type:complete len:135 (+),score=13.68 GILK01002221.1:33-407(+)
MGDFNAIGTQFVQHYYATFDSNRANLGNLYNESSMLTFEGAPTQGAQNIVNKLVSLAFQSVQHVIKTLDCQPSGVPGGIIAFVSGDLVVDGGANPIKFAQVFHLLPTPNNSYFCQNDMFRLNYG